MKRWLLLAALSPFALAAAHAALRGHGGPVRAIAVSPDGRVALTGSFDTRAILWSLDRDSALAVLSFHDKAVNAVAMLGTGRFATASEDGRIALWAAGSAQPERILEGHTAPVSAVAVSPDGRMLASASWDRTVRIWPFGGDAPRVLEGHRDNVNGVAFSPDGATLVSAGYDATLRFWPVADGAPRIVQVGAALNAVAIAPDGEVVAAGADGRLRFFAPDGALRGEVEIEGAPVIAIALSPDGAQVAASGLRGAVKLVARAGREVTATLVGPALPVWALSYTPDGRTILAAGSDRLVRRWNARTGEAIDGTIVTQTEEVLKAYADDPGAQVFRACIACHTLTPDDGLRAGPTLHRLFGRRIATAEGYPYSPALKQLDIVWTPETVAKLFEIGPAAYTPGTKMPEQTLSAEERAALVRFLQRVAK